ncbi:hypothetical protein HDE69_001622 [Pedobacter cryoconitis]|uniref:Uncharacterized protein n=1 Tax=Pedobacter cryoconitis TaxID=188932 RepID=A0A7W9DIW5_9SPHI|nr:DUF6266 family protein [Pedobacter cryoconitis]MBB5620573.1 hypothetical protein [Pedobacter cryoconitis]
MAIIQEGTVLAGIRGKIGKVVIYPGKSKVCARSTPAKPRKKAVRTVKQQAQSNKMKVLSSFLNAVNPFLQVGFKQKVKDQDLSANNAAKSVNMKHAIKGEFPEQEINWDTILVAHGDLIKPENVVVKVSKNTFNFTWDEDKTGQASPNDRTMILLYNKEYQHFFANYSGARRDELKDTLCLDSSPIRTKGRTYEVFIVFKDIMSDEVSKSVYCGSFENQF